jgi:multiple antibiotic resistance protein
MLALMQATTFSFAAIFPILNPLGSAVIFLTLTLGTTDATLAKIARQVAINTFILLVIVLLTGSWILRFFGITIPVVQIGGGLVVAYIGWRLLNQSPISNGSATDEPPSDVDATSLAFYPLTMPITAGPGCIATTLTIGAHEIGTRTQNTMWGELGAVLGILLASITVYFCYRYARAITKSIGPSGTQVIMRLFAFINMCIGIQIVWNGVAAFFLTSTLG